ncbi:E3 ubiquitin-protein ligase TRIM45-like [Mytilus trossulus]|uniref:E3 ubiquitin-protein ligase TRIM45-like n=1 Tax=Mytilus trossulus TaxID=6551 RepID=UPI0030061407
MASNWNVCGVCDFRSINKASVVWCSECDEGLCGECREHHDASKSTMNHGIISITEYQRLPSNVLAITQTCHKHIEQYQTFCKKHDCPCCRRCVIETHNDCKDLTAIDDIVQNVKSSNAILEVEQTLVQMLETVRRIRNDRSENLKCIQDQRVKIERHIKQTRKMINDHLDKVQESIMKELYSKEENESKRIKQLLSVIEDIEKGISNLKVNLNTIKLNASDLQTFLALKHIEKEVSDKEECIYSALDGEGSKNITLSLLINKENRNICRAACFGSISVESKSCKVVIGSNKSKQAQMIVPISFSKCIDDVILSKKLQINLKPAGFIKGCAILQNGKMMLCDYNNGNLFGSKSNGTHEFDIRLDTCAFDFAYFEKLNAVSVTDGFYGDGIHFINPSSRRIKRSIRTSGDSYGIAVNGNALVYCKSGTGIMEIKWDGKSEKALVQFNMPHYSYVAVHGDNIYYINKDNHSVTCYNIHGNPKWEFRDAQNLRYPQGISIDSDGNVYVASMDTSSLVIITPDGKRCRTILSSRDGLSRPHALHFEPTSNKLLVANEKQDRISI